MSKTFVLLLCVLALLAHTALGYVEVRNVHVSMQDSYSSGKLAMSSLVACYTVDPTNDYKPLVIYGASAPYERSTDCTKSSYTTDEDHWCCVMHKAYRDGRTYKYTITTADDDKVRGTGVLTSMPSGLRMFTAKNFNTAAGFSNIALVGDIGIANAWPTIRAMSDSFDAGKYTGIIHLGDISYADDHADSIYNYEVYTNQFFELIEPLASRTPYFVLAGNHDVSCRFDVEEHCPMYTRNFTAYNKRWSMPNSPKGHNLWYSFDDNDVHYVVINTETDLPNAPFKGANGPGTIHAGPFGDQLQWLEQDLARARASRDFPWIVILGHRPLYSSNTEDYPPNQMSQTRADLEDLFLKYNVDMYISGHVHAYQRMYPIKKGEVVQKDYIKPTAPVYIVSGAGGSEESHCETIPKESPYFIAKETNKKFGFSILTSGYDETNKCGRSGSIKLCQDFYTVDDVNTPFDSFCIYKCD